MKLEDPAGKMVPSTNAEQHRRKRERTGTRYLCCGFNGPYMLRSSSSWSKVSGTVWEAYGTFRKWSLDGGSVSVGVAFEVYSLVQLPVHFSLLPVCSCHVIG